MSHIQATAKFHCAQHAKRRDEILKCIQDSKTAGRIKEFIRSPDIQDDLQLGKHMAEAPVQQKDKKRRNNNCSVTHPQAV
jgi:hypothetical protein